MNPQVNSACFYHRVLLFCEISMTHDFLGCLVSFWYQPLYVFNIYGQLFISFPFEAENQVFFKRAENSQIAWVT